MQSVPDPSMMAYMSVPGSSDADVAAMDNMQFMDALLLDNDSIPFGESAAEFPPISSTLPSPQPQVSSTSMQGLAPPHQQQQQPLIVDSQQQQMQPQQAAIAINQQQHLKPHENGILATAEKINNFPLATNVSFSAPLQPPPTAPPASRMQHTTAATDSSTSTSTSKPRRTSTSDRKRPRDQQGPPVSEDECEKQKRRMDRNLREQQRSHKITEQISQLRDLLASANANVHYKPDKNSTLISVVDYIRQMQSRSAFLDAEHKKLIETISQTNEVVNSAYETASPVVSNDLLVDAPASLALEEEHAVFVRGLDYKNVFKQCSVAIAIASIDGRFMDCNTEFEVLTGYERDELLPSNDQPDVVSSGVPSTVTTSSPKRNLSLFNLVGREDMEQVFLAMSLMLKRPVGTYIQCDKGASTRHLDYWSGYVSQSRLMDDKVRMNVTLVRSPQGRPKFFQCALTPDDQQEQVDQQ